MSTGEIEATRTPPSPREELLRRRLAGLTGGRRAGIARADRDRPLPLSFGQQQMWFLNRMEPGGAEYLVPLVLRLRGALDVAAVRHAWTELVARHEVLRTRYALRGGEPVQVIDAAGPADLPVTGAATLDEAIGHARRDATTGFDLERQWPARARLVRLSAEDHLLVLVFHHIACDAWSMRVVVDELSALYRARVAGVPAGLAEPRVQYADFAAWERGRMAGQTLQRHLRYWREQLAGLPTLDLPADRPRAAVRGRGGALVTFAVPDALARGVGDLARRYDVTPFVVLLTGFQVLLARYAGTTDVVVGTAVSGRARPELQSMVGYGINSLALRTRWDGDPAFAELLGRVRGTVLDAFDHQDVPFAKLVDELQPDRDLSRTPLFQVVFDLLEEQDTAVDLGAVTAEPVTAADRTARFDLTLQILMAPDGAMRGRLEYATALFDEATARRLTGHLVRLLESATAAPDTPVATLDLLPEIERHRLVRRWNDTARPLALADRRVHEVFAERAAESPDAIAVVAGDRRVTYAELDAHADRIAHYLRGRGIGPEATVGVLLDRSPDLVAVLLGVWKAGGAYVPLDPAYPPGRMRFMLADTAARLVVTEEAHAARVDEVFGGEVLVTDSAEGRRAVEAHPATPVEPAGGLDDLAYVIYTSGSTGTPKGVLVPHRGLSNYLAWTVETYASAGTGGAPLFSSVAFDLGVPDLYTPLLTGQPVHLLPQDAATADLGALLAAAAPFAFIKVTPGHLALLAEQLTPAQLAGLAGLAIAAGDSFTGRLANRWRELAGPGGTRLAAEYGPTEITVGNSGHEVTGPETADLVPIGRPIPNTTMYVLDALLQPVPIGVVGEVHIGGTGVTRGYAGRPGLTAGRYLPAPFGAPGERLYRTGDLARVLPDGNVEFVGRVDDQVKVRGYRVELGEIQTVLAAHPAVRDAVVVAHGTGDEASLVAYCVPATGEPPTPGDLAEHCAARLPEYMTPVAYLMIGRVPLTANGKLDRAALPAPDRAAMSGARQYTAPRTPLEERVAALWAGVLGLDQVGVHDGFFDVGGDSIRAVALVGELKEAGLPVTVRDVFDHRTVAALCEILADGAAAAAVEDPPRPAPFELVPAADRARLPAGVTDAYPPSRVQLGMIVEMLAGDGRNKYHNVTSFRIRDDAPFAMDAFLEACALVVARHEILRTSFDLDTYSTPLQLVHDTAEMSLGMRDLRGQGEEAQERAVREYTAVNRAELFDLRRPPLLRLFAYVCDDDVWWLSTTECHPILEGWSHHSLLMELLGAYRRLRDGLPPDTWRPPGVRYADFIAAEQAALESAADRDYWTGVVGGYERFQWPDGLGDSDGPLERLVVPVLFDDLVPDLRALASAAEASLKSVLLAAHMKVLGTLCGERRFFSGLVCNARPEVLGADRAYGMYLNTLPFAHERGAATWRDLVRRVFAREVELWPHRRYPMPAIQQEAAADRLVETSFSYQDFHQVDTDLIDYLASVDESPTEFAFSVSARVGYLILTSNTQALTRENGERLAEMYRSVLESMAADPDGDARLGVLPGGELSQVVEEWNGASALEAPARSVLDLFEEQVVSAPDAVALVAGGERVSFAELDRRANRVAWCLRDAGVGAESAVGVLLDRGPDLVAVLLGVWKAGAAYVPLDPSHPVERLQGMLADASAALVVTSSGYADRFSVPCVLVDGDRDLLDDQPSVRPDRPGDLDGLAYVIFTSGSTGRPKGVQVTHRGLANHVCWAAEELGGAGSGGAALFSSIAFDLVVPNLWAPLVSGRPVHLLPQDLDLGDLGSALAACGRLAFIKLTPGHLELLAAQGAGQLADVMLVAGEAFTRRIWERWCAVDAVTPVINEYGPTEATVGTCVFPVPDDWSGEVIPIGRPLPGMAMYVLDEDMQPVPVGVPGELFVGGTGVARGYVGRAGLTAERFVPNPFGSGRLYRTGDRVQWAPEGFVEFLGRMDDQVKIRGYRIEPGEVAAVLSEHPHVTDAAVTVWEPSPDDRRLVGYYVQNADTDTADLAAHCAGRLPEYMVPAVFVRLDELPLNANGKLDRNALPAPDETAAGDDQQYVAPRNIVEEQIARIWAKVLGIEQVGVHQAFFDLGGHSIRAVALVGALRAAGFDVAVRDVFERRTVAEQAELLTGRPANAETTPRVEPFALVPATDREHMPADAVDAYPLSQVQLGMLVEMLADGDLRAYHNVASFRVRDEEPFSVDALRRAAALMAERHEMLRTSFHLDGYSLPLQVVHAAAEIPVEAHDLRHLDEETRPVAVRQFTAAERTRLLDLDTAPLMRMAAHVESDGAWWLTVAVPHAITEGWSHRSLLMELLGCYRAVRAGLAPDPWEPPDVRYADFIAAELASIESGEDWEYWQDVLARYGRFALPDAWAGDPSGPREKYRVAAPLHDLEAGLRGLATRARASLKSVLLAAHLKVLSMLTDEPRFFSGLVYSARPEVLGADRVYGMYLNTLPFAHERDAATWSELVRQVFDREVEVWAHRRFPMPVIQRRAGAGRLVDVRFSYQDFHQVDTDLIDMEASLGEGATEFALAVSAVAGYLVMTTDTHTLSRENAERLTALYRSVLESMAADPDGEARVGVLPERERSRVVEEWNGIAAAEARTHSVLDLFEEQVVSAPDAVALVAGGERVSFAELDRRANRVAWRLRDAGVDAESAVGVLLDRGPDLVAVLLGVWKAGAAYVPLDPSHPVERLRGMLADASAALVVTSSGYADRFSVPCVLVDEERGRLEERPCVRPDRPGDLDGTAYVIFTSGSTGRPKGVQVTHRGLANHVCWAAEELGGAGSGGAALFSSIAFDLVVPNLWAPLVSGRPVHLLPQDLDLDGLGPALAACGRLNFIKLTPGHLELLAAQGTGQLADVMLVAGEAFTRRTWERWRAVDSVTPVVNEYGPTEATVGTCVFPVPDDWSGEVIPIGRPLPGMEMYVLDGEMEPVPAGVPGELFVGGTGVARGYVGRPGLTAERFVPNPFTGSGGRLYRTGDRVRWSSEGVVEFLGRMDDQVKIRGYRIEPGEIAAVLAEHPHVTDAAVTVWEPSADTRRLAAYYVADTDAADLAAHCAGRLPEYMVPAVFVRLDELPLNANGKLDRNALPAPDATATGKEKQYVAPRTETERILAGLWTDLLDVPQVGLDDGFFDLGGHSILIIQMVARARSAGLTLSLRMLYEHETLGGLAAAVEATRGTAPAVVTEQRDASGEVPLTPVQRRFLAQDGPRERYLQSARLTADPEPDAEVLEQALHALVEHHDALRFRLKPGDDRHGLIAAQVNGTLLDRAAPGEDRQAATERAMRGMDLERGPLLRAMLFPAAAADGRSAEVFLVAHHLVVDIVSWSILVADLETVYEQLAAGGPAAPPAKSTPFKYWAERLVEHASSPDLAAEADHWLNRVAGPPLPADRPDGGNGNADVRTVTVSLSAGPTEALVRRGPAALGARPDEVLLTALGTVVTGWTGGNRLLVDLEGHGREDLFDDVDLSRTVGWFTGVFPAGLWVPARQGREAALKAVTGRLRAVPGNGIGYGLLRHLSPDEDLRRALAELPDAEIIFNYTGPRAMGPRGDGPRRRFTLAPQGLASFRDPARPRTHQFQINAGVHDGRLHIHWSYAATRYDETTVRRLADGLITELTEFARLAHPDSPSETPPAGLPSPVRAMAEHHVPGVSIAVLRDGEPDETLAFGTLAADTREPVTPDTLFQAGSLSKHVTALAVLRMVADGHLDLDEDARTYLTSWRLPGEARVTIRNLLSHMSGLSPVRNRGYRPGEPVPSLPDLLAGRPPVDTPPVRMEDEPGRTFRRGNVNYDVLQLVLTDVTEEPFPALMRRLVLDPLGMHASGFEPGHPAATGRPFATGHDAGGVPLPGRWRVRAELAAAGLWATAADLAKITREIRAAYLGRPAAVLTAAVAREMLTAHSTSFYGLGTVVDDLGGDLEFGHGGEPVGYRHMAISRVHDGTGFVVLTNAESGKDVIRHLATAGPGLGRGRLEEAWTRES